MKAAQFVLDQDFSQAGLAPELGNENPKFEQRPDGRQYPGRVVFPIQLPFPRYAALEIRAEITFKSQGAFILYTGSVSLVHEGNFGPGRFITRSHSFGAQWPPYPLPCGERLNVLLRVAAGEYMMQVGDEPPMRFEDPDGPEALSDIRFIIDGGALVHRVRVEAEPAPSAPRYLTSRRPFQIQVSIDFADDLYYGIPYGPGHFKSMLDHFEQWGVKRINWIQSGGADNSQWEDLVACLGRKLPTFEYAVRKTFEMIGSPLDYLVKHGHERGMEIYPVFKPHEAGFTQGRIYCEGTPEAKERGRVRFVDGWTPGLTAMLRGRQDLLVQRRPGSGPDDVKGRRCRAIRLWHWKDEPIGFPPEAIRIWVSRDNASYSLYDGPRRIVEQSETRRRPQYDHNGLHDDGPTERVRVLTIDGLETDASFVVLTVLPKQGHCVNALFALAEILDDQGRPIPFSYGWAPGWEPNAPRWGPTAATPDGYDLSGWSLRYDLGSGSSFTPWDQVETTFDFGLSDNRLLGFAKGKNPCIGGAAEAACPEVRAWWLSIVRKLIAQGVDGVDFRPGSHNQTFEWKQYGFNPPIVEEYRRRYGVDILTENFDLALWRRLRGEYYGQFLREAAALLHAAGRKCQVHIFDYDESSPERGNPTMNMFFDYRTWLAEGFIDGISNKGMQPSGAFWRDICRLAEARQIPICFVPWAGTIAFNHKGWPATFKRLFDSVRESGQSGVNLYECCCLLRPAWGKDELEVPPEANGFTEFMQDYNRR